MDETGRLFSWGDNSKGQLGDNALGSDSKHPARIGSDSNWAGVSAGESRTLAVDNNGGLRAWGANDSGRLGFGTPLDGTGELTFQTTPRQAGRSANWADISTAAPDGDNGGTKPVSHTLAIDTEGRLYSWGSSGSRELGRGAASGYLRPGEITLE